MGKKELQSLAYKILRLCDGLNAQDIITALTFCMYKVSLDFNAIDKTSLLTKHLITTAILILQEKPETANLLQDGYKLKEEVLLFLVRFEKALKESKGQSLNQSDELISLVDRATVGMPCNEIITTLLKLIVVNIKEFYNEDMINITAGSMAAIGADVLAYHEGQEIFEHVAKELKLKLTRLLTEHDKKLKKTNNGVTRH